ncbi:hypothetical protein MMC25_006792 [Agyrium rufum]|nr:hypothetical protein [Agyrium rufum]
MHWLRSTVLNLSIATFLAGVPKTNAQVNFTSDVDLSNVKSGVPVTLSWTGGNGMSIADGNYALMICQSNNASNNYTTPRFYIDGVVGHVSPNAGPAVVSIDTASVLAFIGITIETTGPPLQTETLGILSVSGPPATVSLIPLASIVTASPAGGSPPTATSILAVPLDPGLLGQGQITNLGGGDALSSYEASARSQASSERSVEAGAAAASLTANLSGGLSAALTASSVSQATGSTPGLGSVAMLGQPGSTGSISTASPDSPATIANSTSSTATTLYLTTSVAIIGECISQIVV